MDGDANRGGAFGGIRAFAPLARSPELTAWRARAQRIGPYLVGGAMFAMAIWVLRARCAATTSTTCTAELASLSLHQLGSGHAVHLLSFMALIGYEWSALGLVGKRMPFAASGAGLVRHPVDRPLDRVRLRDRRQPALPFLFRSRARHRRCRQGADVFHRHLHAGRGDARRWGRADGADAPGDGHRPAATGCGGAPRRRRLPGDRLRRSGAASFIVPCGGAATSWCCPAPAPR